MDPVSALGTAAAGAQFVGLAVKSLLGVAKLVQDMKDEPRRAVELLKWIENEADSMCRLLHPDSPVFSYLSTTQYIQIAPCAMNTRKVLDKIVAVLSPVVQNMNDLKSRKDFGNKIILLWKSIFTIKMMKDIESDLSTIRILNATLLRELQVSGFETQSLLREQSAQVLSIVLDLSKRNNELHESMEQVSTLQRQNLEMTRTSTAALAQTMRTVKDAGNDNYQEILRVQSLQMTHLRAIQDMLRSGMDVSMFQTPARSEDGLWHSDTRAETSTAENVKRQSTTKGPRSLRCKCYSKKLSSTRGLSFFALRTDQQAVQVCPLHGRVGQKKYTLEAKLHPWIYGSLQISLGVLFQAQACSILPSLKFQGTVKRSESPIFKLIDDFISSCSVSDSNVVNYMFPGTLISRTPKMTPVKLVWDSEKTKVCLAGVIRGIEEAAASGLASCNDMDERGCTLLTEMTLLYAYLGKEIFNVETEMVRLFQIAYDSNLDPTTRFGEFKDGRDYGVYHGDDPRLTLGETLAKYTMDTGMIGASLYEALLDYEGLVESASYGYSPESMRSKTLFPRSSNIWKVITTDACLAEALGYSDFSLAIITRSLESLRRQIDRAPRSDPSGSEMLSPLELALGWPEGLKLLVDNKYDNSSYAYQLACENHDIKSADILLRAKNTIASGTTAFSMNRTFGTFEFASILDIARGNMTIFRLAAEELWRRKDKLIRSLIRRAHWVHKPDLLLIKSGANKHKEVTLDPPGLADLMEDVFSSAIHSNGQFNARHHRILFATGFTSIDTWCGTAGTPLSSKFDLLESYLFSDSGKMKEHMTAIQWLLKQGANPRLQSWDDRVDGKHVQFFLALALHYGVKLDKAFLKILGRLDEKSLHDDCVCLCSSGGCIPSFSFCRDESWFGIVSARAFGMHSVQLLNSAKKWARYWRYSKRETEFIHRELCRHELFERLGMKHLCCASGLKTTDERRQIKSEDESSAQSMNLLLHFYVLLRKLYLEMPIGRFLSYWWGHIDDLLPPLRSSSEVAQHLLYTDIREIARDQKWRTALEEAGYKDWEYQDVIRDHCTKMVWKAQAYKQRKAAWRQHRLVSKPRFSGKQPLKQLRKQSEEEWIL